MTLTGTWRRNLKRIRQLPNFASACVCFFISACVELEPRKANNQSPVSSKDNYTLASSLIPQNPSQAKSSKERASWEKHQNSIQLKNQREKEASKAQHRAKLSRLKKSFNVKNRMSLRPISGNLPLHLAGEKYSFQIDDTDIRFALRDFASENKLNILVDQEVQGKITVNFERQSLNNAMAIMLATHNYYWAWDNELIRINRLQTKLFVVNYLRLVRSGQAGSSSAIVNRTSADKNADGERSSTSIQQNDSLAFWEELEDQLSILISDQGRFVINRLSGTIQVTDMPARITEIDGFISSLQKALHRQVEIDTRILEVTLSDNHALGIDWSAINIKGISATLSNIVVNDNNQGLGLKTNTLAIGYSQDGFKALINALEEQGSIQVVSQPRIRILNNQPALIKVGTDRTFFTQTSRRFTALSGTTEYIITEQPTTITEGLVLTVTPQISKDQQIMLDISPIITRIIDVITSPQGSTAPVLEIKQASTLIRAKNGEMIILGGLIQEEVIKTDRQVPFFSRLPLIGKLFQGNKSSKIKKELVIFIVPRLII